MSEYAERSADGRTVGLVERRFYTFAEPPGELVLESGGRIGPVTLAYETYGELSPEKDNCVLICHALSGDSHVAGYYTEADPKPGWWEYMVGPGKGIDTDKYFVVCSNILGSCMGSTGPASINPATGKPYGLSFPVVTIADMVADLRAPTPSAAAEMVAKSRLELEGHLDHLGMRLASQMRSRLNLLEERVEGLARRLRSPIEDLQQRRHRIDELEQRLQKQMAREVAARQEKLGALTGRLDALSPLGVLNRGYAIVMHGESGAAVRCAEDVAPGDPLHIRLKQGHLQARVTEVKP